MSTIVSLGKQKFKKDPELGWIDEKTKIPAGESFSKILDIAAGNEANAKTVSPQAEIKHVKEKPEELTPEMLVRKQQDQAEEESKLFQKIDTDIVQLSKTINRLAKALEEKRKAKQETRTHDVLEKKPPVSNTITTSTETKPKIDSTKEKIIPGTEARPKTEKVVPQAKKPQPIPVMPTWKEALYKHTHEHIFGKRHHETGEALEHGKLREAITSKVPITGLFYKALDTRHKARAAIKKLSPKGSVSNENVNTVNNNVKNTEYSTANDNSTNDLHTLYVDSQGNTSNNINMNTNKIDHTMYVDKEGAVLSADQRLERDKKDASVNTQKISSNESVLGDRSQHIINSVKNVFSKSKEHDDESPLLQAFKNIFERDNKESMFGKNGTVLSKIVNSMFTSPRGAMSSVGPTNSSVNSQMNYNADTPNSTNNNNTQQFNVNIKSINATTLNALGEAIAKSVSGGDTTEEIKAKEEISHGTFKDMSHAKSVHSPESMSTMSPITETLKKAADDKSGKGGGIINVVKDFIEGEIITKVIGKFMPKGGIFNGIKNIFSKGKGVAQGAEAVSKESKGGKGLFDLLKKGAKGVGGEAAEGAGALAEGAEVAGAAEGVGGALAGGAAVAEGGAAAGGLLGALGTGAAAIGGVLAAPEVLAGLGIAAAVGGVGYLGYQGYKKFKGEDSIFGKATKKPAIIPKNNTAIKPAPVNIPKAPSSIVRSNNDGPTIQTQELHRASKANAETKSNTGKGASTTNSVNAPTTIINNSTTSMNMPTIGPRGSLNLATYT